ncbi:putative tyrosinase co-factor protein [Streptomyces sp. Tu6071]|nr:putative tyrosinase co-factor protein [Streptomyces sp. Tu6071]
MVDGADEAAVRAGHEVQGAAVDRGPVGAVREVPAPVRLGRAGTRGGVLPGGAQERCEGAGGPGEPGEREQGAEDAAAAGARWGRRYGGCGRGGFGERCVFEGGECGHTGGAPSSSSSVLVGAGGRPLGTTSGARGGCSAVRLHRSEAEGGRGARRAAKARNSR